MASPVSPGEVIAIAKFAYRLWKSCKAAKGEFDTIAMEVSTMDTVIQLVHCDLENPKSIMNLVDNKEKTIRKQLGIHIRNCENALTDLENLLKRYNDMSILDKAAWALWGRAEVAGLKANLSSFATQLDSWMTSLTLKAVGLVNSNVVKGIGRIEGELERNNGNDKAAVAEVMRDMKKSGVSHDQASRYSTIISSYAKEVSNSECFKKTQWARTPDPPRGRKDSNALGVPEGPHRAKSADALKPGKHSTDSRRASLGAHAHKKPKYFLECWLIQIKSGQALFLTFKLSEKEQQTRGQWKLEEMASQFKSFSTAPTLEDNHDLIQWVVKDREKHEYDDDYTWSPYAAKVERKGSLYLGMGVEEQAMVIIRRQLTAKAQRKVDEEQMVTAAKRKASTRKAELEKIEREKLQRETAKKDAAKRKANEATAKRKKEKQEKQRRLEEENAKLKAAIEKFEKEKQSKLGQKISQEGGNHEVKAQTEKRSKSEEPKAKKEAIAEKPEKKEKQPRPEQGKAQKLESVKMKEAANDSGTDCQYFPNCLSPSCKFRHPKMPMCQYGPSCTVEGCRFTHKHCKFRPCIKPACSYRHDKGQRMVPDTLKSRPESSERSASAGKKAVNEKDNRSPMKDKDVNKM